MASLASLSSVAVSSQRMALPPIVFTMPKSKPAFMYNTPVATSHSPMTSTAFCSPSPSKKRIRAPSSATMSITLEALRPHFSRPLAEVAALFGICMTLMKKICRKNGLPRWPHRQIRGLRKSIAAAEKALLTCESMAQHATFVNHRQKQQAKLDAILRGPEGSSYNQFHEIMSSTPYSFTKSQCYSPSSPAVTSPDNKHDQPTISRLPSMASLLATLAASKSDTSLGTQHVVKH